MNILPAVLAGGEGRRMGGAKPLRPWGPGTLIENALRLAGRHGREPVVSLRREGQAGPLGTRFVLDAPGIEGPLAGLAALLAHARRRGDDAVFTLPCDMPRLPADLGERLLAALEAEPQALAALARAGGDLHPVCAVWRVEALGRLAPYLASDKRSLRGFATACDAVFADWPAEEAPLFANANTPDELAQLAGLAAA